MTVKEITQSILDRVLLPEGITSHHLRRIEVDRIGDGSVPVNREEYVVFRRISTGKGIYGDGRELIPRRYIDVNYYYSHEKSSSDSDRVDARIKSIIKEFRKDSRFRLVNGPRDIEDAESAFRGIHLEFLFLGEEPDE